MTMRATHIDHAHRLGPLGRLALIAALHAAQWLDTLLHHLTGGRTDAPIAWLLISRT